jgi:hypothetical protein
LITGKMVSKAVDSWHAVADHGVHFVTVNIGAVAEAPWCQWMVDLESFVSDAMLSAASALMVLSPGRHGEHPQRSWWHLPYVSRLFLAVTQASQ